MYGYGENLKQKKKTKNRTKQNKKIPKNKKHETQEYHTFFSKGITQFR